MHVLGTVYIIAAIRRVAESERNVKQLPCSRSELAVKRLAAKSKDHRCGRAAIPLRCRDDKPGGITLVRGDYPTIVERIRPDALACGDSPLLVDIERAFQTIPRIPHVETKHLSKFHFVNAESGGLCLPLDMVTGKCGSVTVRLIPAPRGTGIVSAPDPNKLFPMAGAQDCYTSACGSTGTLENFANATYAAIAKTFAYLTSDLWREIPPSHPTPSSKPQ